MFEGAFQAIVMLESVAASRIGALPIWPGIVAHAKYYVFEGTETPMELLA